MRASRAVGRNSVQMAGVTAESMSSPGELLMKPAIALLALFVADGADQVNQHGRFILFLHFCSSRTVSERMVCRPFRARL